MSSGYFGDILSETLSPSKKKHKHNARDSKSSRYTSSTKATLTFDAEDDTDDILRLRQTIQEKRRQNQEIMRKLEEENASVRDIKNKRHQQRYVEKHR